MNIPIHPKGWVEGKTPNGTRHLNWGIKAGNQIFVAGMLSTDPYDGSIVGVGDIEVQTRRVLDSIKDVIEAGGGTMADVTFNQIFLRDLADYNRMNAIYVQYFPDILPARFCVKLDMVKPEFLVEIATTAVIS
ncbi:endoribonuclease L-PSP [Pararhizobium polonicum]|uniref:Endoribonuclease L-PSP n=1 Tax=Pararhizobium polonicum TaxID=1612624 RepID=A0A1C7NZQ1_9HYPH|nr:Rid family hydrolase [Pararhizobium polonicum]OBZ94495.1 endoribonuclease L-PSP [Pararhizobium polonicum]